MRRHDWAERMFAELDASALRPFAWGDNDCCLFPARVVDAMTDSTYEQLLRGTYTDERSALEFIVEMGGLEAAVTAILGPPSNERATRGDVVSFDGGEGDSLGICIGPEIVGVGPEGLRRVPRSEILKVWKV